MRNGDCKENRVVLALKPPALKCQRGSGQVMSCQGVLMALEEASYQEGCPAQELLDNFGKGELPVWTLVARLSLLELCKRQQQRKRKCRYT